LAVSGYAARLPRLPPADRVDRVERGKRVLEDHRDGLAVDLLPLRFRHPQQVPAAQQDLAEPEMTLPTLEYFATFRND
jgi:hypothetical protein